MAGRGGGEAMKIIHVPRRFTRSEWGGTETVILETCKWLRKLGHEVEILCPNALAASDEEEMEGVRVRRAPYFYPYLGLSREARRMLDLKGGNLFSFSLMRRLKKMAGVDVIHAHTGKRLGGICRHVARKKRIPYVLSLHGGALDVPAAEAATWTEPARGAWEWGKALGWWVGSRRVMDDAAAVICVGKREQEIVAARLPGHRVVYQPNGVDAARFAQGDGQRFRALRAIPREAKLVLTVGRIDPQKNQRLALAILAEVMKTEPDARLALVGHVTNPAYRDEVAAEMRQRGLDGRVTLIEGLDGASQELVDAYHAADVFLLPSAHEPFGIVILEAWAAGRPVVATRVGGVPWFVADGKDGLLFESNDAAAGAAAVARMLKDKPLAARLASAGQRKAREEYGWEGIARRLAGLYEEVIRENPLRQ
ncbi:MAG TPA: glycosyltransferase family 4 protein [Candidatus Brocadiia bacterium]|nr:glycosyltransferase family 4 protein [Candidatus Brocadiia bacterium]